MLDNTYRTELEKQWQEKFPSTLSGLFSFYQCLCTIAIIGCEIGSVLIDQFNATIYVGFWASLFFIIAWISQAAAVTCRRTRKCATYTLIIQCITLVFAACVIGFDAYFLIQPNACFFSSTLCNSTGVPGRGVFYSADNFNNIKIPIIKGQLATGAIMFAFCVDYIIMYVVTHSQVKNDKGQLTFKTPVEFTHSGVFSNNQNTRQSSFPTTDITRSTTLISPTFQSPSARSILHSRWSIDSLDLDSKA